MSSSNAHDIKKEVKGYLIVFLVLSILTIVTVAVKYLHLPLVGAIILALIIASVKASLVACYFMHLISEQKLIYIILAFTVVFFIGLLALPSIEHHDVITGTTFNHPAPTPTAPAHATPASGEHHVP